MSFAAAILRETCTFQARSEVGDGGGGIEVSWTDRFVRRGAIAFANLSAQLESIQQGELSSRTRATVTVREDPETRTITPDWRVRIAQGGYTSDVWNIRDVIRAEPGWLRMSVEKGVSV